MKIQSWKDLSTSLLTALRILFLMTVSWDFFLTIIAKASQRALLLTGIGAQYTPFIIIPWACAILILAILLLAHLKHIDQSVVTTYGYAVYIIFIIIYTLLTIITFMNPLVAWPLAINYLVNITWAAIIIYFRFKVKQTSIN